MNSKMSTKQRSFSIESESVTQKEMQRKQTANLPSLPSNEPQKPPASNTEGTKEKTAQQDKPDGQPSMPERSQQPTASSLPATAVQTRPAASEQPAAAPALDAALKTVRIKAEASEAVAVQPQHSPQSPIVIARSTEQRLQSAGSQEPAQSSPQASENIEPPAILSDPSHPNEDDFVVQNHLLIKKATRTLVTETLSRKSNIMQINTHQVPFVVGASFLFNRSSRPCNKYLPCSLLIQLKLMAHFSENQILTSFRSTTVATKKQLEELAKYSDDLGSSECLLICLSEFLLSVMSRAVYLRDLTTKNFEDVKYSILFNMRGGVLLLGDKPFPFLLDTTNSARLLVTTNCSNYVTSKFGKSGGGGFFSIPEKEIETAVGVFCI